MPLLFVNETPNKKLSSDSIKRFGLAPLLALKFIMNSRNLEKKSNFIIFKAMESTSKFRFNHYLLNSNLNDKF